MVEGLSKRRAEKEPGEEVPGDVGKAHHLDALADEVCREDDEAQGEQAAGSLAGSGSVVVEEEDADEKDDDDESLPDEVSRLPALAGQQAISEERSWRSSPASTRSPRSSLGAISSLKATDPSTAA